MTPAQMQRMAKFIETADLSRLHIAREFVRRADEGLNETMAIAARFRAEHALIRQLIERRERELRSVVKESRNFLVVRTAR